jgi:hypothetical protein
MDDCRTVSFLLSPNPKIPSTLLYCGGHMFYTWSASRVDFTADAEAFYMDDQIRAGNDLKVCALRCTYR